MIRPAVNKIAEIACKKGLRHIVLAPGSRSAPISLAFIRYKGIKTFVVPDERSAAYIALGMSLANNNPVGLVCTSGTASLNFYPAIAEAFYQQVPLVVFTADRPPEWIDQQDGQTIRQHNLYGRHVKESFTFPLSDNHTDESWYGERIISEAINKSVTVPEGPVHINLPFQEPLYPEKNEVYAYPEVTKTISRFAPEPVLDEKSWTELSEKWAGFGKIMILSGQGRSHEHLSDNLIRFTDRFSLPVLGDLISNLPVGYNNLISRQELILLKSDIHYLNELKPDLLITFNLSVLSKNTKLFLRKFKASQHWHIGQGDSPPDTFQSLTCHLPVSAAYFFETAVRYFDNRNINKEYLTWWKTAERDSVRISCSFFPAQLFSELEAVKIILDHLPDQSNLHLANSMPVRLVNYFGLSGKKIEVFANRGTSGIDGCNSTAVGAAIQSKCLNILITGDMAFFYDRNAFWHSHVPSNLFIILLNNHGGGIFRIIDGPSGLPELDDYFETHQNLYAENTAKDFGMEYFSVNDSDSLKKLMESFFVYAGKPKILEIETKSKTNKNIFDQFITQFK